MRAARPRSPIRRFLFFLLPLSFLAASIFLTHFISTLAPSRPISSFVDYSLSRPCALSFVHDLCDQGNRNDTIDLIAAHATTYGAFGNNFIQLLIVLQFCILVGLREIFVDAGFCWLTIGMTFQTRQRISITAVNDSSEIPYERDRWIDGQWFFPCCWCPDFTWRYLADSIRDGLWQVLPRVTVEPETLYLYTRGGPLVWEYEGDVHPSYGQPPCDYYLQVMKQFEKVRVIGDFMNPCVNATIQAGAFWELYDDKRNFAMMVGAKYLVLAKSSRSHVILAMSRVWKRFWMFDQELEKATEGAWWRGYSPLEFGDGENCVPSDEYRSAITNWKAAPWQVEFVLNSTCTFEPMEEPVN
jgi:hypothetical protein